VFPCRPAAKVPHGSLVPHGCLDAAVDPAVIIRWWKACPAANVAIATGTPGPDVADFDVKAGAPGVDTFARLRGAGLLRGAGAVVTTPSGGWHLYFAGSGQGNATMRRHGVDFRSAGGYVLAPPSRVLGDYPGAYELAEHRPGAARLDFAAVRRFLDPPRPMPRVRPGARSDLGSLAQWVAGQVEGNRNAGLFWAACRAVGAGHDDLASLVAAAVDSGLSETEALRTVASARRRIGGAA
jgi:hypothetical protein